MQAEIKSERAVLSVGGGDRRKFLQGLITNDLDKTADGPVYTALLTPQGKYLADFFVVDTGDRFLIDVAAPLAAGLAQRLTMYKLRADVVVEPTDLHVRQDLADTGRKAGQSGDDAAVFQDPRHPRLGYRAIGTGPAVPPTAEWEKIRVALGVPESGVELIPNETYILEAGFEALNGVDFKKGCYVGQEVTARMKHKATLRKGLVVVDVEGRAPVATTITANGRDVGVLYSQAGGKGIAYLRFDRAAPEMTAGDAVIRWQNPEPKSSA